MNRQPLQIGIVVPSENIPSWISYSISELYNSPFAQISAIFMSSNNKKQGILNCPKQIKYWAYHLYLKIENLFFKPKLNAFKAENIKKLFPELNIIELKEENGVSLPVLKKKHKSEIKIDLAIQFSQNKFLVRWQTIPRYGIWKICNNSQLLKNGFYAGFWEVIKKYPVTEGSISVDFPNNQSHIIYQTFSPTHPYSILKNANRHYWKMSSILVHKLRVFYETFALEVDYSKKLSVKKLQYDFTDSRRPPDNIKLILNLIPFWIKTLLYFINKALFLEQWVLLYNFERALPIRTNNLHRLIPPPDRLWADPHTFRQNGSYYIFIEEKLYATRKGHISYIKLNEDGTSTKPQKVLETPYHLSYPFIFKWNNILYMIPESSAINAIALYRCIQFPDKWKFVHYLMENVCAVDATLHFCNNKWWLFTNIKTHPGATNWDQLFLFYADTPLSREWKSHVKNPIISDAMRARPAGKILKLNGKLIRPSQDCSSRYGAGIRFNEIIKISPEEYLEREIDNLHPDWDKFVKGTHTVNFEEKMTIVDAILKRPKFFGRDGYNKI